MAATNKATASSELFSSPSTAADHWASRARPDTSTTSPRPTNDRVAKVAPKSPDRSASSTGETVVKLPAHDLQAAKAAARAGRELASRIPEDERNALIAEHQQLSQKVFRGGLSASEERRLRYVRWSLDRIEDAANGAHLDHLRELAAMQEGIAAKVERFAEQVRGVLSSKSKHHSHR